MAPSDEIIDVFASITDEQEMYRLFQDMFTEKEREDIALRWQLLKELHMGNTQRSIASRHRISLCKITRGSKILKEKNSAIKEILNKKFPSPEK